MVRGPQSNLLYGPVSCRARMSWGESQRHGPSPQVLKGEVVVATLESGSYFGEIAMLNDVLRTSSVRVLDFCQLLVLNRTEFDRYAAACCTACSPPSNPIVGTAHGIVVNARAFFSTDRATAWPVHLGIDCSLHT